MSTSSTRKGVRLVMPGAPDTAHHLPELPGVVVWPYKVTPIDDEETLARATELAARDEATIEVVPVDSDVEPWRGYSDKSADDIVKKVEKLDAATAGAVIAYETANKNRRSVVDAAAARISTEEA